MDTFNNYVHKNINISIREYLWWQCSDEEITSNEDRSELPWHAGSRNFYWFSVVAISKAEVWPFHSNKFNYGVAYSPARSFGLPNKKSLPKSEG
jgi:hypothetical protein